MTDNKHREEIKEIQFSVGGKLMPVRKVTIKRDGRIRILSKNRVIRNFERILYKII